jgi:hypothetical protein
MLVTAIGAAASSHSEDWKPLWLFLTLLVLVVLGDRVHARMGRMRLSAGLTIIGLAMGLLGPAPAVAICWVSRILDAILTDGIRLRGRRLALVWNLGMYVNVLIGGLLIEAAVDAGISRESAGYALIVVAAISVAMVINFLLAAVWIRAQVGMAISEQFLRSFVTQLPWLAAPNILAGALVALYIHVGPGSLLLSLALVGAFYVLLLELLNSQRRREELEQRTFELASLQVGVLVTMVRTLSLRDRFTARHSAAVARYAHAIAKAAGCSDEELRHRPHRRAAARHRKVCVPRPDPPRQRGIDRRGLHDRPRTPGARRRPRPQRRGARGDRIDHPRPPRANRRPRLPARPVRERDPRALADDLGQRHVRRDDLA